MPIVQSFIEKTNCQDTFNCCMFSGLYFIMTVDNFLFPPPGYYSLVTSSPLY